jgi:anti-anti-sigma factor
VTTSNTDGNRLRIQVDQTDATMTVRVGGELDSASTGAVASVLAADLDPGITAVVVDLGEVTFMDSTGITALVHAHRTFEASSVRLTIDRVSPPALRVLQITGLATMFGLPAD